MRYQDCTPSLEQLGDKTFDWCRGSVGGVLNQLAPDTSWEEKKKKALRIEFVKHSVSSILSNADIHPAANSDVLLNLSNACKTRKTRRSLWASAVWLQARGRTLSTNLGVVPNVTL